MTFQLSDATRAVLDELERMRLSEERAGDIENGYNVHYRGEAGNELRYAATRRSCSPRASGRSASTEVSP